MFKIGDQVQTSAVFHQQFPQETPLLGTVDRIDESALIDDTALPYMVYIYEWQHHGKFAADELDLL